jgi:succinoglycan biosynthesis transport protein ExoP
LGVVPGLSSGENMVAALRDPHSAQSEAFSSLATAVQQARGGGLPKTVLVTSSQAHEGKSTSTMGLARGLRTLGHRVLVVNGDLRNPSGNHGFSEMLDGSLNPQAVTRLRSQGGLMVIDSGMVQVNPVSLLSPSRVRPVLAKLAQYADIILVDGPPILGLADAVLLSESVETVLMVVEANRTEPGQLDTALSRLPASIPVAGLLTKFDARKAGVSYGDYEYYSYGGTGSGLKAA